MFTILYEHCEPPEARGIPGLRKLSVLRCVTSRGHEDGQLEAGTRFLAHDERVEPAVDLLDGGVLATAHAEDAYDLIGLVVRVDVGDDVAFGVGAVGDLADRGEVRGPLDHLDCDHRDVLEAFRHRGDSLVELDDLAHLRAAEANRKASELTGEALAVGALQSSLGELVELGVGAPVRGEYGRTGGSHRRDHLPLLSGYRCFRSSIGELGTGKKFARR